ENGIGPEGAKALAVALTPNEEGVFNTSLRTLDLGSNNIGPEGAKALAVALTPNAEGVFNTSLDIVTITAKVVLPIGALRRNELTELDLSRKDLKPEDAIILGAALVSNGSLNTLDLGGNSVGPAGAKALAVALTPNAEGVFNGSLNTLNVWRNAVQLEGARALADAMRHRNAPFKLCGNLLDVEELDLSFTRHSPKRLEPADAILLANDLVFNGSLSTLNLAGNFIELEEAKALITALTPNDEGVFNKSLRTLDLGGGVATPLA
ncbi:hypothetical protein CYMTET_50862, partial [Cymbomonas tetramitiformis]